MQEERKVYKFKKPPKKGSALKKFIAAVLIIAAVPLSVYIFNKNGVSLSGYFTGAINTYLEKFEKTDTVNGEIFTLNLNADSTYKYARFKDHIAMAGMDGVRIIDAQGKDIFYEPFFAENPLISTANNKLLAANKNKPGFLYVNTRNKAMNINTDNGINMIKMTSSGFFTVTTEEPGYDGAIYVFNPKGEQVYIWNSGSGKIIDSDISPNGKILAVAVLNLSGKTASSSVLFFNIGIDENAYAAAELTDNVVASLSFQDSKSLVAAGSRETVSLDNSGKINWKWNYDGLRLVNYNIETQDMLVFTVEASKIGEGLYELVIFNKAGEKKGSYKIKEDIKSMQTGFGKVYLTGGKSVIELNSYAKEKKITPLQYDVSYGMVFSGINKIFCLFGTKAAILNLR